MRKPSAFHIHLCRVGLHGSSGSWAPAHKTVFTALPSTNSSVTAAEGLKGLNQ